MTFNISPDSPEIPSPTPLSSPSSEHDLPTDSEPSSSSDDGYTPLQVNKVLSGALKYPSPVSKQRPEVGEKVTARVLTSIDSLRAMEEKEKKRREELQLNEERCIARELKAQAKKSALKAASVRGKKRGPHPLLLGQRQSCLRGVAAWKIVNVCGKCACVHCVCVCTCGVICMCVCVCA